MGKVVWEGGGMRVVLTDDRVVEVLAGETPYFSMSSQLARAVGEAMCTAAFLLDDYNNEEREIPPDTPSLDTSFHDNERDVD